MMQRFCIARHGSTPSGKRIAVPAGAKLPGAINMVFADGHVEHVRASRLSSTFQRQGLVTNRLVIP